MGLFLFFHRTKNEKERKKARLVMKNAIKGFTWYHFGIAEVLACIFTFFGVIVDLIENGFYSSVLYFVVAIFVYSAMANLLFLGGVIIMHFSSKKPPTS